jgi:GNAT superfamily N-acetyltransferase
MVLSVRRLTEEDAVVFRALRLEGFALHPREFRYAPEDEADRPLSVTAQILRDDYVVGGFFDDELAGIAGLHCDTSIKVAHKALLWGMYVRQAARGSGLADGLMKDILDHAKRRVEIVNLTVAGGNGRALRFYERWGFRTFGVEPQSIKFATGDYADEAFMQVRFD